MKFDGDRLRLSASDVANFVACQHLTRLDLLKARGTLRTPREFDIGFQDLVKRGEAHEVTVLDRFRADGRSIVEIGSSPDTYADAAQATLEAISDGADVIYQGVLLADRPDGGTALLADRPDGGTALLPFQPGRDPLVDLLIGHSEARPEYGSRILLGLQQARY